MLTLATLDSDGNTKSWIGSEKAIARESSRVCSCVPVQDFAQGARDAAPRAHDREHGAGVSNDLLLATIFAERDPIRAHPHLAAPGELTVAVLRDDLAEWNLSSAHAGVPGKGDRVA